MFLKKINLNKHQFVVILTLSIFTTSIACTPKEIASNLTSQILRGGSPAFEREADVELAETTGLTMIKMIEAFQYDNPKNKTYQLLLSRSYANYAFGFLEGNLLRYQDTPEKLALNQDRAKRFYELGKQFGLDVLESNGSFRKAMSKDLDTFQKSLKAFGKGDVPALFWTAFNWGSLINLSKDSPQSIIEFPKVEAIMKRVVELDENYFYGGPLLFFGVSYGSRPAMFGGNPAASKDYFEKAANAYKHRFLMTLVLQAQYYAVQTQNAALYDQLLNEVLSADAAALPEQRLANELAKVRAQWLVAHKSQYFGTN